MKAWAETGRLTGFAVLTIALWQVIALNSKPQLFPGPWRVFQTILRLASTGALEANLFITFKRIFIGFVISVVIGVAFGVILASSGSFGRFFEPAIPIIQTVPSTGWSLIAVIWFGLSEVTPIFVVVMTCLPIMVLSTWSAVRNVNADWIEMAHAFHVPRPMVIQMVILPAVLPYLFSALRLSFGFAWRISSVAEALGASSGVGFQILTAANLIQTDAVLAWIVSGVLMMLVIEYAILRPVEAHFFQWRKEVAA
jgi:NitT/TauT family transport system permease protein